jgi:hypothetical protein
VASRDTLFLIAPGEPDGMFFSRVQFLINASTVHLENKIPQAFRRDTMCCEIHYVDNPDQPAGIAYRYLLNLKKSSDSTITLTPLGYPFYPIEWLELEGEPVQSFGWRIAP